MSTPYTIVKFLECDMKMAWNQHQNQTTAAVAIQ